MRKAWRAVAAAAVMGLGGAASAHEVKCEKKVNGKDVETLYAYPATVTYGFKVSNVLTHTESLLTSAEDASLASYGWAWPATEDYLLYGSESIYWEVPVYIESYEKCKELAYKYPNGPAPAYYPPEGPPYVNYDNYFKAKWKGGEAQCSARLVCYPAPKPPPSGKVTRTLGFYKTHAEATKKCLEAYEGYIDLGYVKVDSLEDALGLLWGSPARYVDGGKRNELDQKHFLLARQTLVGLCNYKLFYTPPYPADLLEQAKYALSGTACYPLPHLNEKVDAYNNSGTYEPLPYGIEVGHADPRYASGLAYDPTYPSGKECSDY